MPHSKKRTSKLHTKVMSSSPVESASNNETNEPFGDAVIVPHPSEEEKHSNTEDQFIDDLEEPILADPRSTLKDDDIIDIVGNGLLLKKTLKKGYGRETRPNHGDLVEIRYSGWLEDGTLVEEMPSFSFALGDGDVIQAFELALTLCERGEIFELITDSRFAYGSRGREPDIPGNAKLRYEIELLTADDPPCYTAMSNEERFAAADQKRERGNYYYKREECAFAVNSYNKALEILTVIPDPSALRRRMVELGTADANENVLGVSSEELEELEIKVHNNLAVAQLKIQAYDAAIKSCDSVLRKDPSNFKALFRKGRAYLGLGDADEAVRVLTRVRELVPTSLLVQSELQRARIMQRKERERWANAANRAFPKSSSPYSPSASKLGWMRLSSLSRYMLVGASLIALISIGVAWYTGRLPKLQFFNT